MAAWGYQDLGQVQRAQGRLDAAAGTYRQALEVTAAPGRPALPAAGIAYVGLAEVAYQRNELDTALRHVTEGIGAVPPARTSPSRWPPAWPRWRGSGRPRATRPAPGRRWKRPGRPRRARAWPACSTRSRRSGPGCCWPRATSPRPPAGPKSAASAADDEPGYPREPEYLVLARVLLAQDRPGPALGAAGPAARGGRQPRPHRQRHRDPGAAGAGAGSQRRGSRRGGQPWPTRSRWPARRATCGSSPTRARRWPPCSAG